MFRKIFISLSILIFTLAPVWATEGEDSTAATADSVVTEETASAEKSKPPKLIGGSLLPGTSEDTREVIQKDSSSWLQITFFRNVINQLIGFTAALAVLFLIVGGYQYLTAVGNDEQIKQAHKTITWSLGGLLLALLAFAIVQILVNIDFDTTESNLLAADVSKEVEEIVPFMGGLWDSKAASEVAALPQGDFKTEFLPMIARFLIYGMAFVAFLVFFAAGVWLVLGWGEEESIKKAKSAIIWGVTGLAFAAASYAMVKGILGVDLSWGEKEGVVAEEGAEETAEMMTVWRTSCDLWNDCIGSEQTCASAGTRETSVEKGTSAPEGEIWHDEEPEGFVTLKKVCEDVDADADIGVDVSEVKVSPSSSKLFQALFDSSIDEDVQRMG